MPPVTRAGQTPVLTLSAQGPQRVLWVADGGVAPAATADLAAVVAGGRSRGDAGQHVSGRFALAVLLQLQLNGLAPLRLPDGVAIHSLGEVEERRVNKGREVPVAPGRYLLLDESALDRTLALFVDRDAFPPIDFTSQVGLLYLLGPWDADTWKLRVREVAVGDAATTVHLHVDAVTNPPANLEHRGPVYQWALLIVPKRPFGEIDYTLSYTGWRPRLFGSVEQMRELVLQPFFARTMDVERVELKVEGRKGPLTVRLPEVDMQGKDFQDADFVSLWARANALPKVLDGRAVRITDKNGLSLRAPFGR